MAAGFALDGLRTFAAYLLPDPNLVLSVPLNLIQHQHAAHDYYNGQHGRIHLGNLLSIFDTNF
jgi:hypothetical protein